ncbi:DUF535 family protein [Helicobacter baculiformis]|uniref:DUF535 family protein n=1 Tax=Helicobacter baculiformis TaxID=427351 RepID=A0ABV7ZHC1_9HELI|nr:DUF535 family protein [Helicobacter baculiformis]
MLITVIQSISGIEPEHIKFLTKYCYCQPAFFLVELQIILTRVLGLNKTLGIPNVAQISYIRYAGYQGLARDYDDLFMQCGAVLVEIGGRTYYDLPHTRKDLSHYPSKTLHP